MRHAASGSSSFVVADEILDLGIVFQFRKPEPMKQCFTLDP